MPSGRTSNNKSSRTEKPVRLRKGPLSPAGKPPRRQKIDSRARDTSSGNEFGSVEWDSGCPAPDNRTRELG